jgi:hypothetical protein
MKLFFLEGNQIWYTTFENNEEYFNTISYIFFYSLLFVKNIYLLGIEFKTYLNNENIEKKYIEKYFNDFEHHNGYTNDFIKIMENYF